MSPSERILTLGIGARGAAAWLMTTVLTSGLVAQEAQQEPTEEQGTQATAGEAPDATGAAAATDVATRTVYTPEDFERFVPRSANDMVRQIPGFTVREGGGDRGLGQADTNVLINGRRISGKSNGPVDALQRIPAGDVLRLEIVDGASLDLAGLSGQVLNVVTSTEKKVSGQYRYAIQAREYGTPIRWGDGEISLSGSLARSQWNFGFQSEQDRRGDRGPEFVRSADGSLLEVRREREFRNTDRPAISGSFTHESAAGNVFNLTGLAQLRYRREREISEQGVGESLREPAERTRDLRQKEDEVSYEIGADYEFDLGASRVKVIGLHRFEHSPTLDSVRFDFGDGRPATGSDFRREADESETILRTEFTFDLWGGDLQLSLEGVNNVLDAEATLEQLDENGQLRPVPLPGASSRVEEQREEITLSFSRTLTPRLQLQASVGAENSEIEQSGPLGLSRDFVRPKGLLSLDWSATPNLDISTKLERVVGQLNFFDFVASVNLNQEQEDVTNANLVPPQSWLLETELNQRLGEYGSVTLRLFGEEIDDIVDQIPIEGGGQSPGNIDSAERYGASIDLTLLTDPFAWRGGRWDLRFGFTETEVLDPLLGTPRRISGTDNLDLRTEFRQDFYGTDWASGLDLFYEEDGERVRLDQIILDRESFAFASIYLEHKDVFGLTIRGSFSNVFDRDNEFTRTIFADRAAGIVDFSEQRVRQFGPIYTLTVQGSF